MELQLTTETESKLNELAQRTNRGTDELIAEAVEHLVTYNAWLDRKIASSIANVESSGTIPDETVRQWLKERKGS